MLVSGKKVLEDISFNIDERDFLTIIDPNGSGKTTLIKAILNIVPHSGEVEIFEKTAKNKCLTSSYYLDLASGATIIMVSVFIFLATLFIRPLLKKT